MISKLLFRRKYLTRNIALNCENPSIGIKQRREVEIYYSQFTSNLNLYVVTIVKPRIKFPLTYNFSYHISLVQLSSSPIKKLYLFAIKFATSADQFEASNTSGNECDCNDSNFQFSLIMPNPSELEALLFHNDRSERRRERKETQRSGIAAGWTRLGSY